MKLTLPVGLPTSIGSLPHTDPDEAARFVLGRQPRLPAAPSLPVRSAAESMLGQAAWGVHGVSFAAAAPGGDGITVDALDPDAPIGDAQLDSDAFVGLRTFLAHVADRHDPIKLQLTGPVTLGLALRRAGAPSRLAFAVAASAVRQRAHGLVELAGRLAPHAPLVVFVDEPGLTAALVPGFPLAAEETVDLVSGALAALEPVAVTGLHCCGPTDWSLAMQAGPQILSLTMDDAAALSGAELGRYLEGGGWVAWGAVPTDGPVGTGADRLWRALSARWCELVQGGCDPVLLRTQALITPACGLALHGITQATHVLDLTNEVAARLHDQAIGVRLSVGA